MSLLEKTLRRDTQLRDPQLIEADIEFHETGMDTPAIQIIDLDAVAPNAVGVLTRVLLAGEERIP